MAPTTHFLESTLAVPQTVRDIQRKLDTAAVDGDTIVLKGRFAYASTEVLRLYKSVTLQGDPTEGATIVGGKQIEWGQAPDGTSVPIAATLDNITFDAFTTCAIRISGAGRVKHRDNLIRNCRFTNYRYGIVMKGVLEGAWPIIAEGAGPLGGSVTNLTGTLTISGCHFGAPDATSIPLDANGNNNGMNNLIHVNNCDLQHLVIKENVFDDVYWMGIAVWGVTGLTEILDNTITKKSSWLARPGSGNGIAFGLRPRGYPMTRDGSVTIARNTVDIASPDSYGIVVGLYAEPQYLKSSGTPPARSVIVRDNVVHMKGVTAAGAPDDRAALACLGACSSSSWTNNVVTGSAQFGILVSQDVLSIAAPVLGAPMNNEIRGNQLAGGQLTDPTDGKTKGFSAFTALQAQLNVGPTAGKTDAQLNVFGPVSGSNLGDWPPPLLQPCAGIAWFGYGGVIASNDFTRSEIQGWHPGQSPGAQPAKPGLPVVVQKGIAIRHVGCIYLSQMSSGNRVEYRPTDFPKGTCPPPERQILDLAQPNTIVQLLKLKPVPLPVPEIGPPAPEQDKAPARERRAPVKRRVTRIKAT